MILMAIRRRVLLFGCTLLLTVLLAAIFAAVRPSSYIAAAEVLLDPSLMTGDAEVSLTNAAGWLRSPAAARDVSESLERESITRLTTPDPSRWRAIRGYLIGDVRPSVLVSTETMLARQFAAHLSVTRVPQSYALEIGFSGDDPRTAMTVANAFAARLVDRWALAEYPGTAMRVVSVAGTGTYESGPTAWLILGAGALAGLVLGAIAVVIAEHRFTGLTSGSDVALHLDLDHLGNVPLLSSVLPNAASPVDAVVDAPLSGYTEAFRGILVAVKQASPQNAKVFAVTSALPGEGKSTTAACLARSAALAGEKVVIVDCDGRRGGASAGLLPGERGPGLAHVLLGTSDLDEALVHDAASGASVLPCAQDEVDLSSLLGGDAFEQLIAELRNSFDCIFIDTGPILAMAATRSILPMVDGVIMVVRWRATPVQAVKTAAAMMPAGSTSWSGVVLTQVDMRRQAQYGGNDASAYYQQSSAYYR